jgi:four helix bundle protein
MQDDISFQRLDAYQVALRIAKLVHEAAIRDKELADQAGRASKSCFLQLCEGLPNDGKAMRRRYFTLASGSLCETAGAVDLASTLGMMGGAQAREIVALSARLKRMLRRL